jgi:hypothetical protein
MVLRANKFTSFKDLTTEEFLEPTTDESWLTANLTSTANSNVKINQIADDFLQYAKYKKEEEIRKLHKQQEKVYSEYEKAIGKKGKEAYKPIMQLDKNGKETGNFISPFVIEYWRELEKFNDEINHSENPGQEKEAIKRKYKWISENANIMTEQIYNSKDEKVFSKDIYDLQSDMIESFKSQLKEHENFLYESDIYKNEDGTLKEGAEENINAAIEDFKNQHSPYYYWQTGGMRGSTEFIVRPVPKDKWKDPRFDIVTNPKNSKYNEAVNKMFNATLDIMSELTSNLPQGQVGNKYDNFFPQMKAQDKLSDRIKGAPRSWITENIPGEVDNTITIGLKKYKTTPISMIKKDLLAEELEYDVAKVISAFTEMSIHYKYMDQVAPLASASVDILNTILETEKVGSKNSYLKDAYDRTRTKKGELKNAKAHLQYVIDTLIYRDAKSPEGITKFKLYSNKEKKKIASLKIQVQNGEITKEQYDKEVGLLGKYVTGSKTLDSLVQYTYLKALSVPNFVAPVVNRTFGFMSNLSYSAAGKDFNESDLLRATRIVHGALLSSVASKSQIEYVEKVYEWFAKTGLLGSLYENPYGEKKSWTEKLTILQEKAEFLNQGEVIMAMLLHQKIKAENGTEVSVWEAYKMKDGSLVWNEEKMGKMTKPEEGQTFQDKTDVKGVVKNIAIENFNEYRFREKIKAVVERIHGDYSNPMMAKKTSVGRALMLFKTWIPAAWKERIGNEKYDDRLGRISKGRYRSLFGGKDQFGNDLNFGDMMKVLGKALVYSKLFTGESAYANLSEVDQENLKRAIRELIVVLTLASLMLVLRSLGSDDPDEKKFINFVNNVLGKSITDLTLFANPYSFAGLGKTVAPVMITVTNLVSIFPEIAKLASGNGYYKAGMFKDRLRLEKYLYKNFIVSSSTLGFIGSLNQEYNPYK